MSTEANTNINPPVVSSGSTAPPQVLVNAWAHGVSPQPDRRRLKKARKRARRLTAAIMVWTAISGAALLWGADVGNAQENQSAGGGSEDGEKDPSAVFYPAAPGITEAQLTGAGGFPGNVGLLPFSKDSSMTPEQGALEDQLLGSILSGELTPQVHLADMMVAGIDGEEIARNNTEALLAEDLLAEGPQDSEGTKDKPEGNSDGNADSNDPNTVEELAEKAPDEAAEDRPGDPQGGGDDFASPMLSGNADPGAVRDDYEQLEATPEAAPDSSSDNGGQDHELAGLGIPNTSSPEPEPGTEDGELADASGQQQPESMQEESPGSEPGVDGDELAVSPDQPETVEPEAVEPEQGFGTDDGDSELQPQPQVPAPDQESQEAPETYQEDDSGTPEPVSDETPSPELGTSEPVEPLPLDSTSEEAPPEEVVPEDIGADPATDEAVDDYVAGGEPDAIYETIEGDDIAQAPGNEAQDGAGNQETSSGEPVEPAYPEDGDSSGYENYGEGEPAEQSNGNHNGHVTDESDQLDYNQPETLPSNGPDVYGEPDAGNEEASQDQGIQNLPADEPDDDTNLVVEEDGDGLVVQDQSGDLDEEYADKTADNGPKLPDQDESSGPPGSAQKAPNPGNSTGQAPDAEHQTPEVPSSLPTDDGTEQHQESGNDPNPGRPNPGKPSPDMPTADHPRRAQNETPQRAPGAQHGGTPHNQPGGEPVDDLAQLAGGQDLDGLSRSLEAVDQAKQRALRQAGTNPGQFNNSASNDSSGQQVQQKQVQQKQVQQKQVQQQVSNVVVEQSNSEPAFGAGEAAPAEPVVYEAPEEPSVEPNIVVDETGWADQTAEATAQLADPQAAAQQPEAQGYAESPVETPVETGVDPTVEQSWEQPVQPAVGVADAQWSTPSEIPAEDYSTGVVAETLSSEITANVGAYIQDPVVADDPATDPATDPAAGYTDASTDPYAETPVPPADTYQAPVSQDISGYANEVVQQTAGSYTNDGFANEEVASYPADETYVAPADVETAPAVIEAAPAAVETYSADETVSGASYDPYSEVAVEPEPASQEPVYEEVVSQVPTQELEPAPQVASQQLEPAPQVPGNVVVESTGISEPVSPQTGGGGATSTGGSAADTVVQNTVSSVTSGGRN